MQRQKHIAFSNFEKFLPTYGFKTYLFFIKGAAEFVLSNYNSYLHGKHDIRVDRIIKFYSFSLLCYQGKYVTFLSPEIHTIQVHIIQNKKT